MNLPLLLHNRGLYNNTGNMIACRMGRFRRQNQNEGMKARIILAIFNNFTIDLLKVLYIRLLTIVLWN